MFFGNAKMDIEDFDFSNKEGRTKARKRIEEMLGSERPSDRRAAKILAGLFGAMDHVPDEFALVREVSQECSRMSAKLLERGQQLEKVARNIGEHGQAVHRFGMVDAYLTIAGGACAAASDILGKLESYVAERASEKADEKEAAPSDGPSGGSETPTEYPPPPAPPEHPHAAEAPLG